MDLTCVIIEDEPLATVLLEKYVSRIEGIKLLGKSSDGIAGIDLIKEKRPDFILLDINMPEMTGFDMLNAIDSYKPLTIMTTAYPEYAIKGFEHNVVDYLLKPISSLKFTEAIEKVKERMQLRMVASKENQTPDKNAKQSIFVKVDKQQVMILLKELSHIESKGDYLKLFVEDAKADYFLVRKTMKDLLEELPKRKFVRINRSTTVNVSAIKTVCKDMVVLNTGLAFPIGRKFKTELSNTLGI